MTTRPSVRPRATEIAARVTAARARWPLGAHVAHTATGARGVITLDAPTRVPCGTTGMTDAAAWSVLPSAPSRGGNARRPGRGLAVHVSFTAPSDGISWNAWIRSDYLRIISRDGRH